MDSLGSDRQLNRHDSGTFQFRPHASVISHGLLWREIRSEYIVRPSPDIAILRPDLLNNCGQPRHHLSSEVSALGLIDDEVLRNAELKLVWP